jgi:HD domain
MSAYDLDPFRPQAAWHGHNPCGIHGLAHAARVLVWAEQVGQSLSAAGQPVDMSVVRWAAALHDVGRLEDGRDLLHGQRSAQWVRARRELFVPALTDDQLEHLAYVCTWHVPPDHLAPYFSPELTCLKDADGLDRVRIYDLDLHKLRTPHARDLAPAAVELFQASRVEPGDPWEAVRACARRLGWWR